MIEELDPKDPDTTEAFNWDFTDKLAPGDSIATVDSFGFPETDGVLALVGMGAIDDDGKVVSAKLGPCTKGRYYTVRCRITTAVLGETLDLSLRFYCDDN